MANVHHILLVRSMPVELRNEEGIHINADPLHLNKGDKTLDVFKAIDFEVFNLGNVTVFIYGTVPVKPGESWSPQKGNNYPYARNISIKWDDDYEKTKNVIHADAGTTR